MYSVVSFLVPCGWLMPNDSHHRTLAPPHTASRLSKPTMLALLNAADSRASFSSLTTYANLNIANRVIHCERIYSEWVWARVPSAALCGHIPRRGSVACVADVRPSRRRRLQSTPNLCTHGADGRVIRDCLRLRLGPTTDACPRLPCSGFASSEWCARSGQIPIVEAL